jgi:hypothetical protein
MNPYERGLELPKGCKDLIDALLPSDRGQPKCASFPGGLPDVEGYIARLMRASPAVGWMAVFWQGQSDYLSIVNARGSVSVMINSSREGGHERAIRSIFHEAGIALLSESAGTSLFATLRYALPSSVSEAAELVREVLLRGCVVPERPLLKFRVYDYSA